MNRDLALKTLSEQLQWTDQEAAKEFSWLRLISKYKYDLYQGYEPGFHFLESLIGWLLQFPSEADRKTAYEFVRNKLVFFSREEVYHLVQQYSALVKKQLVRQIATSKRIKPYEVTISADARDELRKAFRRSLFVGLSDGARIDYFRRLNEGLISNEQIVVGPEISEEKWEEMKKKLQGDMTLNGWEGGPCFENIFLIDDFTASGTTILSQGDSGEWGGKVQKFISRNEKRIGNEIADQACLNVHHYIASAAGKNNLDTALASFNSSVEPRIKMGATYGYEISEALRVTTATEADFVDLLMRHYDAGIETASTKKNIQLGYKGGGLPIVLEHNTPNNSVALLWAESKEDSRSPTRMKPLFLRRQRHW